MDSQDRLWLGEYRGNRIGMFDTRKKRFEEWVAPNPWTAPYGASLNKRGVVLQGLPPIVCSGSILELANSPNICFRGIPACADSVLKIPGTK